MRVHCENPRSAYRKCIHSSVHGVKLSADISRRNRERRNGMKKSTLILFLTLTAFGVGAADATAQADNDPLRRWDEFVDALLRKVAPGVVEIMGTGYGAVSGGEPGKAGGVCGKQKGIGAGVFVCFSGCSADRPRLSHGLHTDRRSH